jgi:hypothetical protein
MGFVDESGICAGQSGVCSDHDHVCHVNWIPNGQYVTVAPNLLIDSASNRNMLLCDTLKI